MKENDVFRINKERKFPTLECVAYVICFFIYHMLNSLDGTSLTFLEVLLVMLAWSALIIIKSFPITFIWYFFSNNSYKYIFKSTLRVILILNSAFLVLMGIYEALSKAGKI